MNMKIKYMGFVCFCIITVSISAYAETHYVSDKMKITFRTGPGSDRKIITLLGSGQPLEVLQQEGEWSQVQLPNGKEGWVLHRYITATEPCDMVLLRLKGKHEALLARSDSLEQENGKLKNETTNLAGELRSTRTDLEKTRKAFDSLTKESASYLELKSKHKKTVSQLSEQTRRADSLKNELTQVLNNRNIKWFLSGAGVLVLGIIVGLISRSKKKKSSLL